MKNLLFVVSTIAALLVHGTTALLGGSECDGYADAVADCSRRDFTSNFVQYAANRCDGNSFYQCERTARGIIAHLRPCPKCLNFSTDTWTCSIDNGQTCPTEAPITEIYDVEGEYCFLTGNGPSGLYIQQFKSGPGLEPGNVPVSYYWRVFESDVLMPCPPGTYFNFDICKCDHCLPPPAPCAGSSPLVFTLDFDNKASEKGIYFDISPNALVTLNGKSGNGLVFNGIDTYIEVPYFQNNEFRQFKFDGWFNRDSTGGNGEQGILYNGAFKNYQSADCEGTIFVISTNQYSLKAGIVTTDGTFVIDRPNEVQPDVWNNVVLTYDGSYLTFTINGNSGTSKIATGVTLRTKCNLLFGASWDDNDVERFFKGKLDTLSWYREV